MSPAQSAAGTEPAAAKPVPTHFVCICRECEREFGSPFKESTHCRYCLRAEARIDGPYEVDES